MQCSQSAVRKGWIGVEDAIEVFGDIFVGLMAKIRI